MFLLIFLLLSYSHPWLLLLCFYLGFLTCPLTLLALSDSIFFLYLLPDVFLPFALLSLSFTYTRNYLFRAQ